MTLTTIGGIAIDLRSGFASGEEDPNGVIQFRMNNVGRTGEINWNKLRRVPSSKMRDELAVQAGDILFKATNSPELVGKTALFSGFPEPVTFSNHFIRIRTNRDAAEPAYVARWLQREFEHGRFAGMCRSWVNQASITKDQLTSLSFPLPPLKEQKRIAAILDKADALRRKRKCAIDLLGSLGRAIFLDMFGDPVSNPKGWNVVGSSSICKKITDGTHDTPLRVPDGVPFITGKNIRPGAIDLSILEYVDAATHDDIFRRCNPEAGDILYVNIGAGVGNAAINNLGYPFSMKNVALLKLDTKTVTPEYLVALLNQDRFKESILGQNSKGGAQKFLSLATIKGIKIPLASNAKIASFSKRIGSVRNAITQMTPSMLKLDTAFSSLQHRAFSGQL